MTKSIDDTSSNEQSHVSRLQIALFCLGFISAIATSLTSIWLALQLTGWTYCGTGRRETFDTLLFVVPIGFVFPGCSWLIGRSPPLVAPNRMIFFVPATCWATSVALFIIPELANDLF